MKPNPREIRILRLLAEGKLSKQIAPRMGISIRTLEGHMRRLRDKFDAKTSFELAVKTREWYEL